MTSIGGRPSLSVASFASDRRRLPLDAAWIAFGLDVATGLAGQPVDLHLAGLPTAEPDEPSRADHGVFYANEEEAAVYLAQVLASARRRGCEQVWLWRWADVPAARWDQPPYDLAHWRRHTGLVRADGAEKKLTAALASTGGADLPIMSLDAEAYRHDPATEFSRLWRQATQARAESPGIYPGRIDHVRDHRRRSSCHRCCRSCHVGCRRQRG